MKRDRLQTVLRLRELVERQRLAERAAAEREARAAAEALDDARVAFADATVVPGTSLVPTQLGAMRLGTLAHGEAVEVAAEQVQGTVRESERTSERLVAAAVDRRSVERLRERREAVIARAEDRRDARRMDEVALQVWRRHA